LGSKKTLLQGKFESHHIRLHYKNLGRIYHMIFVFLFHKIIFSFFTKSSDKNGIVFFPFFSITFQKNHSCDQGALFSWHQFEAYKGVGYFIQDGDTDKPFQILGEMT